jgi:hypothetical protein
MGSPLNPRTVLADVSLQGVIAIQNTLTPAQSAIGLTLVVFSSNLAGAVFTVLGNTIFQTSLKSDISVLAPSVSPDAALAAGGSAAAVRALLPPGNPELDGVLQSYAHSLSHVFYLAIACCAVSFAASWGLGWIDLRKKKEPGKGEP